MKKLVTLMMAVLLCFSFTVSAFGATTAQEPSTGTIYSINDLEKVRHQDGLTYEEMIADKEVNQIALSKKDHFGYSQLIEGLTATSGVRYYKFTMDDYSFTKLVTKYVLTPTFYVGLYFSDVTSSPDRIVSLDDAHVSTSKGANCVFAGNVFYRLETGRQYYYGVYGNVYGTATITVSGGGAVQIGKSATANFAASYSNNFLKNVDFDGNYYSAGLNP